MVTEVNEGVIGLGVSEMELEIRNTGETPGRLVFCEELGRDKKLENLGLALKSVVVFTLVNGRKTRDVYLPAIIVLTDALGEKATSSCDLKNLVGGLDLGSLLVPQRTSDSCEKWIQGNVLHNLLSFLDINGHADKTTRGGGMWGFPALAELRSLFSDQHSLELAEGNIYMSS